MGLGLGSPCLNPVGTGAADGAGGRLAVSISSAVMAAVAGRACFCDELGEATGRQGYWRWEQVTAASTATQDEEWAEGP